MCFISSTHMAEDKKKKKNRLERLRHKYRMTIINDDTFEEVFNLKLSRLNIINWVGVSVILLIILSISIVAFTPLREYIPGYSDVQTKRNAAIAIFKADSLNLEIRNRDMYIQNIRNVLSGEIGTDTVRDETTGNDVQYDGISDDRTTEDSLMRERIEQYEKYNLLSAYSNEIEKPGYFLFSPVKGVLSSSFNPKEGHYGIDIVCDEDEAVKAAMDGTVFFSAFTRATGYTIQLQHRNGLITVYKHCSAVFKKEGEPVEAGEPLGVVGNTGEYSTGPHLHFEIWENGQPVDPQLLISF